MTFTSLVHAVDMNNGGYGGYEVDMVDMVDLVDMK